MENLHAHEMLHELKTLFAQQAEQELLQTMREFHSCKQEEGQSVSSYVLKIKNYIDNLECLGHPVTLGLRGPRGSRKLKSGALRLYMGNDQRAAMEAIGSYHLSLPIGLVIVLNNFHYAPSITKGIISVSRFVAPRDGIFEIDLSDSYTNVSSIYTLSNKRAKSNLDSALLWHCRLGHISKKRIEKLQHDELLNSTDLKDFSKCVPCMFGKMARKPYSHQVERAKDLLGLIHTNVCGPFKIVSRQRASYFVTFTDDFSRYGYVYLLKHKHEVFETFKVFQKEVENQLENSLITQEAIGSLEDLKIIQNEDTHPSIDTSLNHEEDDLETDEPQSDIIPIRRSTKTRHASNHLCLYIDAKEHKLGDLGEPANYKAALLDPESDKWLNAMNVEIKWLFKKKTDMDRAAHTYKAHLVAKGYTQTLRIDYEETLYPIADIRTIRILIAIAAFYDYEIWQIDVKTAFLNGYLFEEVYMEQLEASGRNITFLVLYVDDILIMENNIPMLQDVKSYLGRYHMENSKHGSIPIQDKLRLSKSQCASTPAELKCMQNVPYALAVGSIMYDVRCTLPDIAFAQNITSRLQQNPGDLHWTTIKNIMKYLRNTKDMFLVYRGDIKRELMVSCYTDSDDIKSQTGYVFVLNRGVVDWKSVKQSIFATSSTEAEYIAAFDASKEAVWVRKFISELGVIPTIEEPISMYCDSTGAITISNESGITKAAKHFRAKVHYLLKVNGDVKLEKVHTDDNLANLFTKALAFPKHSEHTKNI
nr:hypothetical protein [Tanacetum cinerariifolium]